MMYDPEKHILLCDVAHERRIDSKTDEYQEYIENVRNYSYRVADNDARMKLFKVKLPEWPPVKRTPLQLLFGIGADGQPLGPFAKKPWTGLQWAVDRNFWTQKATFVIAKKMVPFEENFAPKRMAYQWQCPVFNPKKHVIVRYWCRDNGVDIVRFLRDFMDENPDFHIFEVTNPEVKEELKAKRGYGPTRRAFLIDELDLVENYFGIRESVLPEETTESLSILPEIPEPKPQPKPKTIEQTPPPLIVPKIIPDDLEQTDEQLDSIVETISITENLIVYTPFEVKQALQEKLGREFRLFGGQTSDSKVVAITEPAMYEFLQSDDTDKQTYVLDDGARNYDCDNFADTLRNALQRNYGINCIGIVWGDKHAWNFFVVSGSKTGPRIIFVEPQNDQVVEKLEGAYSVNKRCEIYL